MQALRAGICRQMNFVIRDALSWITKTIVNLAQGNRWNSWEEWQAADKKQVMQSLDTVRRNWPKCTVSSGSEQRDRGSSSSHWVSLMSYFTGDKVWNTEALCDSFSMSKQKPRGAQTETENEIERLDSVYITHLTGKNVGNRSNRASKFPAWATIGCSDCWKWEAVIECVCQE